MRLFGNGDAWIECYGFYAYDSCNVGPIGLDVMRYGKLWYV